MNATHVVLRQFPGPGSVMLKPGTQVDASTWRNTRVLESSKYLGPLVTPAADADSPRESKKGGR